MMATEKVYRKASYKISVLHHEVLCDSQGASALGTHGMGGVGKTIALKKICSAESVQGKFVDGICFMQFGQDAILQKVS